MFYSKGHCCGSSESTTFTVPKTNRSEGADRSKES